MLNSILSNLYNITIGPLLNADFISGVFLLMPFVLFFEIPWTIFILLGVIRYKLERKREGLRRPYFPSVSCIVVCYSEGRDIEKSIISLAEQIYPGMIQIIVVVDGATINVDTMKTAKEMEKFVKEYADRSILVLPKWQRGGMVSSNNLGLRFATGEIIIKMDGDTSFDNNMVERATRHFEDDTVVAVSGNLRVRNADKTLWTAFQAIEYFIAIHTARTALSQFNMVNNISGAFGVFRKEILNLVEGWDAGTAEDLDMTIRIKNYFANTHKKFRIIFDPEAIGFTDVPETFFQFLKQRLRWEGDYPFVLFKHRQSMTPSLFGWVNLFGIMINIFTHIVIPAMVFVYTIWLIVQYHIEYAIAVMTAVHIFYCFQVSMIYILSVLLLSERTASDFSRVPLLLLMPIFLLMEKFNAFLAILWELFGKGHRDTTMAPWWVLKKNKF